MIVDVARIGLARPRRPIVTVQTHPAANKAGRRTQVEQTVAIEVLTRVEDAIAVGILMGAQ